MDSESYVHRIGRTGRAGRAVVHCCSLRTVSVVCCATSNAHEADHSGSRTAERRTAGQTSLEKFAAKVQQQLESSDLDQSVHC